MNKRFFFAILAVFLESFFMSMQAQCVVSGRVKNTEGELLQGCIVTLLQNDSIIAGSTTDSNGNFVFEELNGGSYVCRATMWGYKTKEHSFNVNYKVKLPDFILDNDPTALSEVEITGDRRNMVQHRAGSSTYFLSERAKQSMTAFEALREIPKLTVNATLKSISLVDGSKPLILINGVKRTNYLDLIDPKLIESVEIIENPSARYRGDEGVGSIINIKLKRNVQPYIRGNVSADHSPIKANGVFSQSIEVGKSNASLYLNMQQFYFGNDQQENTFSSSTPDMTQHFAGENSYSARSYYATLGGDYIFSDKDYIAFSATYTGNPTEIQNHQQGQIAYPKLNAFSDATIFYKSKDKFHAPNANFYYKRTLRKQRSLELTGFYSYSMNESKGMRQERNDFYQLNNQIDFSNERHYGKVNIDYQHPFGKGYNLSVGSNTSYTSTDIDDRVDLFPIYNHQQWQEYLYAGIDNNSSKSKFNYSLSLSLDYIRSNADGRKNSYTNLLPSISLSYRFSKQHILNLKYVRTRIYPSVAQLNPRNTSSDSLHIRVGNPYLTPVMTDQISLYYNLYYKGFYFTPMITYAYYSDWIDSDGKLEGDVYTSTYANLSHLHYLVFSAQVGYNFKYGNIGFYGYYSKRIQPGLQYNGDSWLGNLFANLHYKKWDLNLYAQYVSDSYTRYSRTKTKPICHLTLGRQLGTKWRLSLYLENFLFTGRKDYKTWFHNDNYQSFSSSRMKDRAPVIRIGVNYVFRNKVQEKWRNKKRFYDTDNELQNIKAN